MSTQKKALRRSGAKIMASLILLLGSLSYIMILAVINGSVGFVCAMGVTVFGAVGVAKALGEAIALSYGWIIGLTIGCGVLRGLLRYFEQYSNHYIAFRLLAVLRDKIFGALRVLCPAKLESKQKGSIIAMITSDIETLEVFYAHTISPICIAVLVSTAVFLFVGFVSSWYLALVALVGFLTIGIVVPLISSGKLKESGVKYRAEFASFSAYFLDSNAKRMKKYGVKYYQVSIDGLQKTHDYLRKPGSFNDSLRALQALHNERISTIVSFTISKLNYKDLIPLYNFLDSLDYVDIFGFNRLVPTGNGKHMKNSMFTPEEYRKFLFDVYSEMVSKRRRLYISMEDKMWRPFLYDM